MHAFGVFHTHERTDRDEYVEIKWDNIEKDDRHNFYKADGSKGQLDSETFNVPYDPYSIMHYLYNSHAIDSSKPTIVTKVNSSLLRLHCLNFCS